MSFQIKMTIGSQLLKNVCPIHKILKKTVRFLNQPFSLFEDINYHEFLSSVFDHANPCSAHCVDINF